MVSSPLLLFGLASILLYVTPFVSGMYFRHTRVDSTRTPFEVVLGNSTNLKVFCGGTQIAKFYVLTAAECVINRQPDEIEAFIGLRYLIFRYASTSNVRSVDEIIIHDSYDPRNLWRNDIALLRLGPPKFSRSGVIEPGPLGFVPSKHDIDTILKDNKYLIVKVSGYGIVSDISVNNDIAPPFVELMESCTFVTNWKDCRAMYEKIHYNISDTHICAYDPYISEVTENSGHRISNVGNPLIIDDKLILGITLNVSGKFNSTRYPILFTNVSYYRDWIERIVNRYDENVLTLEISRRFKHPI